MIIPYSSSQKKDSSSFLLRISLSLSPSLVADLALPVFISLRQVWSPCRLFLSSESLGSPSKLSYSVRIENLEDANILESLVSVIQRQQIHALPPKTVVQIVSHYADALRIQKGCISQKTIDEQEIFPWRMLSFFHQCVQENSHNPFILYLEEKLCEALLQDLPLLQELTDFENVVHKIPAFSLHYYRTCIREYWERFLCPSVSGDPDHVLPFLRCEWEEQITKIEERKNLSYPKKIQAAKQIWEKLASHEPLKREVLATESVQLIDQQLQRLRQTQQRQEEKIKRLMAKGATRHIAKAIEIFYEKKNLEVAIDCVHRLLERKEPLPARALAQLFVLLGEAVSLIFPDAQLNLSSRKNVTLTRKALKTIRDCLEHPEDYFLKTSSGKRGIPEERMSCLAEAIPQLLRLMEQRLQRINQLIKEHPEKCPEGLLETLISRPCSSSQPTNFRLESLQAEQKRSFLEEYFPQLWKLYQEITLHKTSSSAQSVLTHLLSSLESIRREVDPFSREQLSIRLQQDPIFRLALQRQVSQSYRLLEQLLEEAEHLPSSFGLEMVEIDFASLKEARNFQTHDLWRKNEKKLINILYLLSYKLPLSIRGLVSPAGHFGEDTKEVQLMSATAIGSLTKEQLLFALDQQHISIDAQDYKQRTLLHFLADHPSPFHLEMARVLLERGANPHLTDYEHCAPLHYICQSGFEDLLPFLLEKKVVVDSPSRYGTPLEIAQERGDQHLVDALQALQSEQREENAFALLRAVRNFHVEEVQELLEKGAQPWIDFQGKLPLVSLFAVEDRDPLLQRNIAELLVRHGADINQQEPLSGKTCLHQAATTVVDRELIQFLLGLQPLVNIQNTAGETPLHSAVLCRQVHWVQELLYLGASPNICDCMGYSPFLRCCGSYSRTDEILKLLLQHGANPNAHLFFGSALHLLVEKNRPEAVYLLLQKGASPLACDREGRFPHEVSSHFFTRNIIWEQAQYILRHLLPQERSLVKKLFERSVYFLK